MRTKVVIWRTKTRRWEWGWFRSETRRGLLIGPASFSWAAV